MEGLMDREQFWRLIDETRPAKGNSDDHALALIERLAALEPEEIVSFEHHILSLGNELDRASVIAVAKMVLGLLSDDGFTYFIEWAILQGKQVVEDLLHAPEKVGRHFPPHVVPSCELTGAIAMRAYERKTGHWEIPIDYRSIPDPIAERPLTDDEIRERFPDLWQRFVEEKE
jgi:Protein of unknown function (DUF4240)